MNRKTKVIVSVVSIFIVLLALVGITYAYFLTQITDNDAERSISITTANLELVYSDGTPEIDLSAITPIYTSEVQSEGLIKTFTVSLSEDSDTVYAKIKLTNLNVPTVIATYDLKWALYKGTTPVATGDFGGKTSGEIVMATNELIDSTTGSTYNLYIWLNETGLDQSNMMNQTVTAKIDVIGYGKPEETLASKILGVNKANVLSGTFSFEDDYTFVETIQEDESGYIDYPINSYTSNYTSGLYVQQGDVTKSEMGFPTYYFRGNVTNNYVKFGNLIWRIVRINEDGSVKIITENNTNSSSYGCCTGDNGNYGYYINNDGTDNVMKSDVETWYGNNIGNNTLLDSKVAVSNYCNDISGNYKNANTRLATNKNPIFTCPVGAINTYEKVGLITADEMMYAGALPISIVTNNTTYLDNGNIFYTMTADGDDWYLYKYYPSKGLDGYDLYLDNGNGFIRAVINLSPDVVVSGGDGLSASTAYVIE